MTFDKTIKTLSAFCATFIIYFFALSFYLGSKGFVRDENGNLTLAANSAIAKSVSVESSGSDSNGTIQNTNIYIDNPVFLGDENAPITIYEYSSFGCSHCADFHIYTLPKVKKDFIETGKVKLLFVDFPLDKKSAQGALLSHCMPKENYFEFLDIVFKNQSEWAFSMRTEKVFTKYASLFEISAKKAEECMKDENLSNKISSNRQQAIEVFGIKGTPALIIEHKGKKEVLHGAPSYDDLKELLNNMLVEPKTEK